MPEIIRDIPQGSEEWQRLRVGSIGGTGLDAVLSKGQGKTRQAYLYQLAAEILSGKKTDTFQTPAMLRGIELEDAARQYYSFVTGNQVEQVTMIKADMPGVHHSPDGLTGESGGVEIKVMLPHTYVELVDTEKIPLKYIRQCQHFLWVSGRKWIDFVAYCPEITARPMWVQNQVVDKKIFAEIEKELPLFISELAALVEKIKA